MRPTDENQGASMRPNLMSPKRGNSGTSGEDSILAMLERDPARKRVGAKGLSGARLAWYGSSAVVAIALTGTLVWLAAGNDGRQPDRGQELLAEAGQPTQRAAPPPTPAIPAPAVVQVALAADAPQPARPPSAAVIVDQQPAEAAPPPLRLLKPAPAAPLPKPQAAAPARPAAKPATSAAPAVPAAPPAQAAVTRTATPAVRPAAASAVRPRPATVARNTVRPSAAKGQRGAQPARTADGPVDPDVALISAVIVHANGHAPEGSQMTELLCPKESCQPKGRPAQQ